MQNHADTRLATVRRRLALLRWWLIAALAAATLAGPTLLDIDLPLSPLLALLLLLAAFNLITQCWGGAHEFRAIDLAGQLAVDLAAMGVMLYLTGGATNPLISLLLLPVAVAAFTLPLGWALGLAALSIGIYSFLMFFSLPLPVADVARATRLHLTGMWLTFAVSALLLAWFVTRMTQALRARDSELAAVREEALRDAQVVALGQLAAGAAHELGTPLATMNVLAGELLQDARLPQDARADLELLRQQIALCKEIVGALTQKAGIERARQKQPADVWLENLLSRWRTLWPHAVCALEVVTPGTPPQLIPEAALEQAVTNLLNNAARIAPERIRVLLGWRGETLSITVQDDGPGFPPEVLRSAGAEPLAPAAQGQGIGLWLTRAAVERRGGRLQLENRAGGRATLEFPLGGAA
jgi:two-component system sensor histidine kinase RegB